MIGSVGGCTPGSWNVAKLSHIVVVSAVLLACENTLEPGLPLPSSVSVTGGGTDTVDASVDLIAQAYDADGRPAVGVEVVFRATRADGDPTGRPTLVLRKGPYTYRPVLRDTTDAMGQASVRVFFGVATGEGLVIVSGAGLYHSDTAHFTTKPGSPWRMEVLPRDRPVYVGSSYPLTAQLRDRYENPIAGAPIFGSSSSTIQVSPAGLVKGKGIGRGEMTIRIGGFVDSAFTSVVPRATIALRDYSGSAGDSTGYAQMDLDGSNYRRITNIGVNATEYGLANTFAPRWIPRTGQIVHLRPHDGAQRLFVADAVGATRRLIESPGEISSEADPDVSRDGAWVYFVGHSANGDAVWRVASRGGAPELILPPALGTELRAPSVSPDGTELVFTASWYPGGMSKAYVRNLSTGAVRLLSPNEAARPLWSPTGEWILYAVSGPRTGDSGHLRLIRPDGTGDHELSNGAYYSGGTWSSSGSYVLVVRAEPGTGPELIDVASGLQLPIVLTRVWFGPTWRN